jgi:hypothetical protein
VPFWHAAPVGPNTPGEQEEHDISSLLEMLGRLPDPRSRQGKRHELVFTLAAAVVAVLAGASNYRQLADQAQEGMMGCGSSQEQSPVDRLILASSIQPRCPVSRTWP